MSKKTLVVLVSMVFLTTFVFAGGPTLTYHGLWYTYSFFWNNADFDTGTSDGDQHYYMHGDISVNADFGAGVGTHVTIGDWGTYGKHAITCEGPEGCGAPAGFAANGVHLMEAYLNVADLFDTPFSLTVGKQHICYGDQVFDGGEDGFMGAKLSYGSEMFDFDVFGYRLVEGGGTGFIGSGTPEVPDDWDLYGIWATAKLLEGNVNLSPYGFYRTRNTEAIAYKTQYGTIKDNPMWLGLRSEGSPATGLNFAAEFTMMMGSQEFVEEEKNGDENKVDYKGMHYMARAGYTPPGMPVTIGGAYVSFSGDTLEGDYSYGDENTVYESPTWGPYTFGFYKDWPGFGPAHLLRTCCGFSLLAPWEPMVANLNVINANIGFTNGPVALRADYFMYARNKTLDADDPATPVIDNEAAMGNEIALMAKYTYQETITFGATAGYWIPGKYFGEDLTAMLGGYIWTAMGF
ncbi:hypothetical protein CH333_03120 [candidate division WOR-3 bacterium JGI_Cruoil_03_44_89]|uniref:Alginate export domain-containing protein n=1 Tax=candidate division WOR-3 bacterium JGI_Cruoil_03_44_89 TaxID=1973748 RepID=A0A235BWB6_UNCW3|nr:MAG: hypothetical protein CH333_03120 [candidate division WOR-3 bacterium JGI_Cruoil_03_44_89]